VRVWRGAESAIWWDLIVESGVFGVAVRGKLLGSSGVVVRV